MLQCLVRWIEDGFSETNRYEEGEEGGKFAIAVLSLS